MRLIRAAGGVAAGVIAAVVAMAMLAIIAAAVADLAAPGPAHPTLLHLALGASDPFVWACAWHSLTVAIVAALLSLGLGVPLACAITRWRYWGSGPLGALAWAPVVVPPVLAALGARALLERLGPWPGAGLDVRSWLGWVWVSLIWGIPIVGLATAAGLKRIDPAWEDAARQLGASRRRLWSSVVWPLVRPQTARALGAVFTIVLFDPTAPLLMGLRRTLAYQIVEAALGGLGHAPRAAVLTLLALVLAGLGRVLLSWWGRARWPQPAPALAPQPRRAGWLRASVLALLLVIWSTFGLLPAAGALALALAPAREGLPARVTAQLEPAAHYLRNDTQAHQVIANSLVFGLAAGTIGLALAWSVAVRAARVRSRWSRLWFGLARAPGLMPPLALGVGLLLLPTALDRLAGGFSSRAPLGEAIHAAAHLLDPFRTPGVGLVLALVIGAFPALRRAAELGLHATHPGLADAARSLGASRFRAGRTLAGLWLRSAPGSALAIASATAATSLVPALLLAPTSDAMPLGPAILLLADQPATGLPQAAALAAVALLVNLGAFLLAARRGQAPMGDWFAAKRG